MDTSRVAGSGLRRTPLALCIGIAVMFGMVATDTAALAFDAQTSALSGLDLNQWMTRSARQHLSQSLPSVMSSPRPATTIGVSNCNDSGTGSLRAAVATAVDDDTVDLTQLTCSTITLTSGAISFDSNITLHGPGAGLLEITGNHMFSVIRHYGTGTVEINGLTIANGKYTSEGNSRGGGCIYSTGSVGLISSVVYECRVQNSSDNNIPVEGGGVFASGNVTLVASTVSGNTAALLVPPGAVVGSYGGGIFAKGNFYSKYSTVTNNYAGSAMAPGEGGGVLAGAGGAVIFSAIASNRAQFTAGIAFDGYYATAPILIAESTISDNVSLTAERGSGIYIRYSNYTVGISNSTITGNTETTSNNYSSGAGLSTSYTDVDLESSIISGNYLDTGSGLVADDIGGYSNVTLTGANNLIGSSAFTLPPDTLGGDPKLAPLADNGGPTMTHALMAGSPAIAAGNNNRNDATDQRGTGYPRVVGTAPDIGAIEYAGDDDVIFADGFDG